MKVVLQKYINDFIHDNSNRRWVIMPGLREVGKTTLMAQIYQDLCSKFSNQELHMAYISVDVLKTLNFNLLDVIEAYERILGAQLFQIDKPIFLFIDEIQMESDWALKLKTIHDQNSNLFILCTGSASTYLQLDAHTAGRRASIERLYPLNFTEYQMIAYNKLPIKGLKDKLLTSIYYAQSTEQVYQKLKDLEPLYHRAWQRYDLNNIYTYMTEGTMPFAINLAKYKFQQAVLDNIDKVLVDDLVTDKRFNFNHRSISKIRRLIYFLADSSSTPSLRTLSSNLEVPTALVSDMLEALVVAEVLIRIPAYGRNSINIKAPARYQFMSSAIRDAYSSLSSKSSTTITRQGNLLEDIAGLHYYREFISKRKASLTYLYTKKDLGYCDFILKILNNHQIALEFGLGQKDIHQVRTTMKNMKCDYGVMFSRSPLQLYEAENIINIPLPYFFLV
ncbi:MAG: AAA family ATPase [Candidatus Saccharibacteria bacterium]|nr:AAA family ATPase [Candidatus Saccharibacteria bacterium]